MSFPFAHEYTRSDGSITLRCPMPVDARGVRDAVRVSLPELSIYMSWAVPDFSEADSLQWINGEFDPQEVSLIALDETAAETGSDVVLGGLGLSGFDMANHACELGYWIRSDRTAEGVGHRAAALACRIAFEDLGMHRVEMLILAQNAPSRRLAEKLGAVHEGTRRGRIRYQGVPTDCEVYAVLATDPGWV